MTLQCQIYQCFLQLLRIIWARVYINGSFHTIRLLVGIMCYCILSGMPNNYCTNCVALRSTMEPSPASLYQIEQNDNYQNRVTIGQLAFALSVMNRLMAQQQHILQWIRNTDSIVRVGLFYWNISIDLLIDLGRCFGLVRRVDWSINSFV